MAVSLTISITQNSQNITNNTSNVTVKATAKWTGGSYNATGQCTGSITIDGTKYSFSGIKFNTGKTTSGSQVVMTKTVNVSHKADGTKTLSCSASFVTGVSSGTIAASGSKTLTTIPRKSTLSVANGTLGAAQTLSVTRQNSGFTHTIVATCGDASQTICSKSTSTSVSFTPPLSWASENTTGTSVSVTYKITTYNGDSSIGTNSYSKTCSIPASVKPTVSLAVADVFTYRADYGAYVQGKSKLQIDITAAGAYGSSIKSYKTTIDGKTYTSKNITTDVLASSGEKTISTTVTDSRGRTATASYNISVLAYVQPKITALTVSRCAADGTASSSGGYLAVKFSAAITSLNSGNSATYTVQYKKTSETEYTAAAVADFANVYSVSNGVFIFEAATNSSYNVILTAQDDFSSIDRTATGASISKLFSIFSKGLGIALGKIAEFANAFEVAWLALFRNHVCVGEKMAHLDGKTGILLSSEGYIHLQRTTAQNYNPYIAFLLDDEKVVTAQIRYNSSKRQLELLGADSYLIDGNAEVKEMYSTHSDTAFMQEHPSGVSVGFGVGSGGENHGIYSPQLKKWLFKCDGEDIFLGSAVGEDRPYYRAGDTITFSINTAGFVTSTKTYVAFHVPLAKPVVGNPTVSVASVGGLKIRQNEKYTHGSGADTNVKPNSYTVVMSENYINVTAIFSTTTNAVNNAPCGIMWSGSVTFS